MNKVRSLCTLFFGFLPLRGFAATDSGTVLNTCTMQTMALFVADPYCSFQCANGMTRYLAHDYHIRLFGPRPVEDSFWAGIDLVCIPGGEGDSESWHRLMANHVGDIRAHVARGGQYLGVCMGAYWAGSHYFDILDSVDCVQYIRQPGTDTRRPHAKDLPVTWRDQPTRMFFYDGCAMVGDTSKFTTVARYSNGDPMAIQQGHIGLIGCHPEAESWWYDDIYTWLAGRWQPQGHHLREFALGLRFAPT